MNQVSRTDEPYEGDDGLNQSPNALSNDLTTNQDLNGIANSRTRRSADDQSNDGSGRAITEIEPPTPDPDRVKVTRRNLAATHGDGAAGQSPGTKETSLKTAQVYRGDPGQGGGEGNRASSTAKDGGSLFSRAKRIILTFGKFVGPGFMVSVAYSTSAFLRNASYRFHVSKMITNSRQSTLETMPPISRRVPHMNIGSCSSF